MKTYEGQHQGDLAIDHEAIVTGQVAGQLEVGGGVLVVVTGQVTGDAVVHDGAQIAVRGMVVGRLLGPGRRIVAEGAAINGKVVRPGGTWEQPVGDTVADISMESPLYEILDNGELTQLM